MTAQRRAPAAVGLGCLLIGTRHTGGDCAGIARPHGMRRAVHDAPTAMRFTPPVVISSAHAVARGEEGLMQHDHDS
jgi:hypothetical protein